MKALVAILVIANLTLLTWGWLSEHQRAGNEAALLDSQINAGKIRIVRGESDPAPPPASADTCIEWGPLSAEELGRARAALEPLALGGRLSTGPAPVTAGWWVYIPPQKSREAADRRVAELRKLGIADSYLVQDHGEWDNAVSLGIFRNEDGAQRFLEELKARGVRSVTMGSRQQTVRLTALYVREPTEATSQRIVELSAGLPGTSVRAAKCP
ncbi:MAG: SPOR domain-containing protein [Betaproteobacteria bacterium]